MLEEALQDPSKQPAEVAQAMLSFVRSDLPNGGTSTEERFSLMLRYLCDRVFGKMQDANGGFKHEGNSWLAAQTPWKIGVANTMTQQHGMYRGTRNVAGSLNSQSIENDPVVQLLGPTKPLNENGMITNETHLRSLIEALTADVESRKVSWYSFPFLGLPETMQKQFMMVLEDAVAGAVSAVPHAPVNIYHMNPDQNRHRRESPSENAARLFSHLLCLKPEGQREIRDYQQKKFQAKVQTQQLQLSPGLSSPQTLGPLSPVAGTPLTTEKTEGSTPNLYLTMFEYFMFLFIRYPLAAPYIGRLAQSQNQIGSFPMAGSVYRRNDAPYGERIYSTLFIRYYRFFLAHSNCPTYEMKFPTSATSEFFLRSVIAFWLEASVSVSSTKLAVDNYELQVKRMGHQGPDSLNLDKSYELAIGKYDPPPTLAQKCLKNLVIHIVKDPTIRLSVMDQAPGVRTWCLSPAMTTLQQSFFNYVRSTLRHATIHTAGSAFYVALDAWLIWLEPWNASSKVQLGNRVRSAVQRVSTKTPATPPLTFPNENTKSLYEPSWEPFIAANLFMYTVPLAIFLRRARELDFSPLQVARSMRVLKRVFRVFTPQVVDTLSRLTDSVCHSADGSPEITLQKTVRYHIANLGEYAPSTHGNLSLSCCQADMQGLLQGIYTQHQKRIRDLSLANKAAAFVEGLFGKGAVSGEEGAIQALVERARIIAGFSLDHNFFPTVRNSGQVKVKGSSTALRTPEGFLTDEGRSQLIAGAYKCSPSDVTFIGDSMNACLRSHEISILLSLTKYLSRVLNKKLGLLPEDATEGATWKRGWRIDLRWFADYRNLLFSIVLMCFSRVLLRFLWKKLF